MSDLIEKVRDVLVKNESETFKDQARAAILAVAEWVDATGYGDSEYWAEVLRAELARLRGDK